MNLSRLLRSLLSFLMPGIVPDGGGGAADPTPEPVADSPETPYLPDGESAGSSESADTISEPVGDTKARLESVLAGLTEGAAEPKPEPTAAPAPQAKAPAAAPSPTPAPAPAAEDLTPPEGMSDRAKERWGKLTARVSEFETRATQAEEGLQSVRQLVANSGLAAEEFTEMLETGKLLKSSNPQELAEALSRIDTIRNDLALRLGRDIPGTDPLAAHPDLKAEVDALSLTRERAIEIAKLRGTERQVSVSRQEQQQQQQAVQSINASAAAIDAALAQRAATPGHAAKMAYIQAHMAKPEVQQRMVATYRPEQWAAVVLDLYDAYTPPAPAAAPGPQPLRPSNASAGGAVRNGPVTAASAVGNAFDRLGI